MKKETNVETTVDRSKMNIKKKPIYKRIIKFIEIIIIIVCVFFAAIVVTQRISNNDKSFFGFRLFRVETGSMIPKYLVGDVILVKEKNFNEIQPGEDISYIASSGAVRGSIVTHQVVRIKEDETGKRSSIITKGIANSIEDPEVYEDQINGVVIMKLQLLSSICRGINNIYIFYFFVIVPLTVYIFFNLLRANRREYQK